MAGEVEESFSMNFQVDSIHSGSISFGRFENEPLSWERRSSFSHNRYLEEVEKCAKPGSVIEKKAYFEAHFKRKGMLGFIPSTGHEGSSDRATSENDGSERNAKQEDFESNDGHYVQFDEMSQKDFELDEGDHYIEMDQSSQEDFVTIEDGHYVQFSEIPGNSNYHEECGMDEYEREETITEYPMVSFSGLQMESAVNNSNDLEDDSKKNITLDEAHQSETSNILSDSGKIVIEVKRDDDVTINTDESSTNMIMPVDEPARGVEETISHDPANPSTKETKLKPQQNSEDNNVRVRKSTPSRSAKDPARIPGRESPRRSNMENNLSKLATPTTWSASKSTKEVSKSAEKLIRENKSENASRVRKGAESQLSASKTAPKGIQEAERLNQASDSTKSNVKPRAAAFNFKCILYEAGRKNACKGSRDESNASNITGSEADAALPSKSKVGNDIDTNESVTGREPSTNHSHLADSMTSNHTSGKKEGAKVSSQKHRVSDSCKGARQLSNERNRNVEPTKQRNDMMRKGVGNVGLRNCSKSGNLAVRVAS
ncbi:Protein WVD2-like 7 [Glycine soja]